MNEMHTAALKLAANGWKVFPCKENSKAPATEHGFEDATTDPDMIALWWTWWPAANVGLATGTPGPDVLDVDTKAGVDGMLSLAKLQTAGLTDGALGIIHTPSGGQHWYYRGTRQGNGSIRGHGIDFRGAGGYVLVPPSVIDGRRYEVAEWRPGARGRALDWHACRTLLDPPRPVTGRRPATDAGGGNVEALARWLSRQPEGNRNHACYWAACRVAETGHRADLDLIISAAVEAGLPEREARRTVQSAARRLGAA